MKTIELSKIEHLHGGGAINSFCGGFGAVVAVYEIGVLANMWNPVGWGATTAGLTIGVGCIVYTLW